MYDDFGGYEEYDNDLETMGDNEAWEDAQAEMHDDGYYEGGEDSYIDSYFESLNELPEYDY